MAKYKCDDCSAVTKGVKLRQGDLMLCDSCNIYRFPMSVSSKMNSNMQKRDDRLNMSVSSNENTTPKVIDDGSDQNDEINDVQTVQNELLAYLLYYYSCSSVDSIRKAILSFYTPEEISDAKDLLWGTNEGKISSLKQKRISTSVRAAHEADLSDILSTIADLDKKGQIHLGKYHAVNF